MAHNKEWTLSPQATVNISSAGQTNVEFSKTLTHSTANKYVTENLIDVLKVSVPVSVPAATHTDSFTVSKSGNNSFNHVSKSGWIDKNDPIAISVPSATHTDSFTVSKSGNNSFNHVSKSGWVSANDAISISVPAAAHTNTFTLPASVGQTQTVSHVTASGWIDKNDPITISMAGGTISNSATTNVTYTENESASTVLGSGGALYINAGWYPNTKITLDHMIPDLDNTPINISAICGPHSASVSKVSVTPTLNGTFTSASGYGVTDTAPTGDYLTIIPSASATPGSVSYPKSNIVISGNTTGFIDKEDGSKIGECAGHNTAVDASVTSGTTKYIKVTSIPEPGVSVTAASASATITDSASILKTTAPSSYYTLTASLSTKDGSATGTLASYVAGAVTSAASKPGTASDVSVTPTTSTYYIPKTTIPSPGVSVSAARVSATIYAGSVPLLTASTPGEDYAFFQTKQTVINGNAEGSLASFAKGYTASRASQKSTASAVTVSQTNNTYYLPIISASHTVTVSKLVTYTSIPDSSKEYGYVRCTREATSAGYIRSAASATSTKYIELYDGSYTLS